MAHTTNRGYQLTPEQVLRRGALLAASAGRDNAKLLVALRDIDFATSSDSVDAILARVEEMLPEGAKPHDAQHPSNSDIMLSLESALGDLNPTHRIDTDALVVEVSTGFSEAVSAYIDPEGDEIDVRAESWTADGGINAEKELGTFPTSSLSDVERAIRAFVAEWGDAV